VNNNVGRGGGGPRPRLKKGATTNLASWCNKKGKSKGTTEVRRETKGGGGEVKVQFFGRGLRERTWAVGHWPRRMREQKDLVGKWETQNFDVESRGKQDFPTPVRKGKKMFE